MCEFLNTLNFESMKNFLVACIIHVFFYIPTTFPIISVTRIFLDSHKSGTVEPA